MADNYDTEFASPEVEEGYKQQFDSNASADYDMQGWYQDYLAKGNEGKLQAGEHYPDTYKKPNHITFSDESQYHGVDGNEGGKWTMLSDKSFAFRPGPTNFKNHSTDEMVKYFKKNEPGNYLLLGGEDAE